MTSYSVTHCSSLFSHIVPSAFLLILSVTLLFRHINASLFGDMVFLGKNCVCIFINCLSEEIGSCVYVKVLILIWFISWWRRTKSGAGMERERWERRKKYWGKFQGKNCCIFYQAASANIIILWNICLWIYKPDDTLTATIANIIYVVVSILQEIGGL